MQFSANHNSDSETDFYLEASAARPLLTAAQERRTDLRKWASARRCLRLLVQSGEGQALVEDFCRAVEAEPPRVDAFESRALFFTLRKDIVNLDKGQPWPAPLMVALSIIHLRRQGHAFPNILADALCAWQKDWARPYRNNPGDSAVLRRAIDSYTRARDTLVLHNLRLVHKLVWDMPDKGVPRSDMVQEGIIGLVRAAEKYDHRRGFRFSTYAYPWINQHLQRSTENRGSLISYPAHVIQEINTLHRVRMQEQEKTGQEPAVTHLAGLTGLEPDKINRLRRLSNITVSMNHPEAEETDLQMAANLPDPDSGRAQRESENSSLKRLLWDRLSMLEEREQTVICGRWGLDGRPQRTFAQLADQLQVSREWVRQLERTALKKLGREQLLSEAYELSQTPG